MAAFGEVFQIGTNLIKLITPIVKNHYICEFVRFELFTDYYKYYDGEVETRTHNVVRSLDMPFEEMWMDFKQKQILIYKWKAYNYLDVYQTFLAMGFQADMIEQDLRLMMRMQNFQRAC